MLDGMSRKPCEPAGKLTDGSGKRPITAPGGRRGAHPAQSGHLLDCTPGGPTYLDHIEAIQGRVGGGRSLERAFQKWWTTRLGWRERAMSQLICRYVPYDGDSPSLSSSERSG